MTKPQKIEGGKKCNGKCHLYPHRHDDPNCPLHTTTPKPQKIEGEKKDWYDLIYDNDNPKTPAYGWIQWKGTDVCIDLHCICGTHGHFDGDFMYSVKCLDCGRKYAVGGNIKLIPLDSEELISANEKYHDDYCEFSNND